jgi:hypothetical protein
MNKVELFLQHYSSAYYDPAAAHEYYLRNRELKGRSTSGMSDQQKEAWSYAKNQISTEKKSSVKSAQDVKAQKIEEFRVQAEATRKRISEKLKLLSEQISKKAETEREKIESERKTKIDSLPPIPKNISPKEKARLMEERKKEIADIREESSTDKADITAETKGAKVAVSTDASVEREQTRTNLKTAIAGVRESFVKAKEELNVKYEKTLADEYSKVMDNLPDKVKKAKAKAKPKGNGKPKKPKFDPFVNVPQLRPK